MILGFLMIALGYLFGFLLIATAIYVILVIPIWFILTAIENKKTREEGQKKGVIYSVSCKHKEGLSAGKSRCRIFAFDDRLEISFNKSDLTFQIPIENVINVYAEKKSGMHNLFISFKNKDGSVYETTFYDQMNNGKIKKFAKKVNKDLLINKTIVV